VTVPDSTDTPRRLLDYAKGRYINDAEFHARVEIAVRVIDQTHDLSDLDYGLVTSAAALGLAMQWVDPATGAILDG
jgi:hypothetical protein